MKKWLIKIRRSKYVKKILKFAFSTASKLPVREKTIVFESFSAKQYSDNPKALYNYIKSNYPDYKLYWSFDRRHRRDFADEDLRSLSRFSLNWILIMARAEFWVINSRLPLWIKKPKHTTYVQTWHGTPLKKLGIDINEVHMPGTNTNAYKRHFLYSASKWDYLISPNAYSTEIFKRAFAFEKTVIESGYPRNDSLYTHNNPSEIAQLKGKLKIPLDKKVILYAPTWRDDDFYGKGKYKFSLKLDLDKMRSEFSDDYVVLLRMHYLVAEQFDLALYGDFVYDFSTYRDISDLYLVSDVLITDYSSVFFDYANLRKPILFFTYDIDSYRDNLRGFYFDFEEQAPGPLVKSTDEIMNYLQLIRDGSYQLPQAFESFYEKFCYLEDGHACERVVKEILNK